MVTIRPHAQVAAGVSVFGWIAARGASRMERRRLVRFDISASLLKNPASSVAIAPDQELPFGLLQSLVDDSAETYIHNVVASLLSRREHSQQELIRKLRRRGFSAELCESAVEYALERGFQSDDRFTDSWIRSAMRGRGKSRAHLVAGLQERGISRPAAEDAIRRYEEDSPGCFDEVLKRTAVSLMRRVAGAAATDISYWNNLSTTQRNTVRSRLLRRGFSTKQLQKHFR